MHSAIWTMVGGVAPLGYHRNGIPIWPIGGGDGTAAVAEGVTGGDGTSLQIEIIENIGKATARLDEIAGEMVKAKDEDTARWQALNDERQAQAEILTALKQDHDAAVREAGTKAAIEAAAEFKAMLATIRTPSKAPMIGGNGSGFDGHGLVGTGAPEPRDGRFLKAVMQARSRDFGEQQTGKAALESMARYIGPAEVQAISKATLGSTDATGGWVIPNAIVDELIKPAQVNNIYRQLCTVVPGVTAANVDIPFRIGVRTRATIAAFGATKENLDLVYNGYTATMYTLARIYDIGNQFLRQSQGAAEQDVLQELAAGFAQGEAYYVREGSGSSEPFGYTSALTNGPATFRSAFTPSATTLAGSIAKAIATAAGVVNARGVPANELSVVISGTQYWEMISQGTDNAGFFFNGSQGPNAIPSIASGTLVAPFGLGVYPDSAADVQGTAAVTDNLIVGAWKRFKVYFGENYRVDSSDVAGTRWDTNLTGFRGEEEMGFDARPAVYAGWFQMVTDIVA